MQPVVRILKIIASSILGAKMDGSLLFLASLVRNTLQQFSSHYHKTLKEGKYNYLLNRKVVVVSEW